MVELSSKSGSKTKSTPAEQLGNINPNLNPGENPENKKVRKKVLSLKLIAEKKKFDAKLIAEKKKFDAKSNAKKTEAKEKNKGNRKTLKNMIKEGSPMASNIMRAFKKFWVAYLSVMRKLSKDWGLDISDLEKSKMAQKMDKSDKLDKIQERLMKKMKMEKISKENQMRLRTKEMLDPNKDIGLFMFNGLGIKPPALPPKKAHEKNKKPKYLDMLMVQLKASGFENSYHDQSIIDGMLKPNSKGERKFYKGDPIFFQTPDGKFTAGFLEGFKDGKFIIQTIAQDGTKTILEGIHQKHVFTAFHIQGNRVPVSSPKPVTAAPVVTTTATPAIQKKDVNKPAPKPIVKPITKPTVKPKATPSPIKPAPKPKPEASTFININANK